MLSKDLSSNKSNVNAFILCVVFGLLGFHRFYVGKYFSGFLQFISLGGFLVWTIIDCIIILQENFTDSENKILRWDQHKEGTYAGLKVRFAAHLIDVFIITIACFLVFSCILAQINLYINSSFILLISELEELINITVSILYYTILTSSHKHATIGKEIVGIMVTNQNKKGLSFAHSLARCLSYFFSYLTFGIGFLMIGLTKKHQGLHDIVAKTFVIYGRVQNVR